MWDLKACRGCLSTQGRLEKISEVSKRLYSSVTGIDIKDGDGYPTYFCMECHMLIRKVFAFRRKCRRAHFVLKEIVMVRKQATLTDILTVNRKRTNLQSSLGKWKQTNNAFYNIDNIESDTDTKDNQISMVQYIPDINESVYHVIDIEPTNLLGNIKVEDNQEETPEDDCIELDTQDNEEPSMDIDLEDVFKDFKDDNNSENSDYELPDNFEDFISAPAKIKQNKENKGILIKDSDKHVLKVTAKALCNVNIKKLTVHEQNEVLTKRLQLEPFKSSTYKCNICLCTFDNISNLIKHVGIHNSNINSTFVCEVCKNKFETELELDEHTARDHLYLYQCKICDQELYTLYQIVEHHINNHKHVPVQRRVKKIVNFGELFDVILLPQEEMCVKDNGSIIDLHCSICGSNYYKRKAYDLHIQSHKEPDASSSMYQCDICKTWHKTRLLLEEHITKMHMYNYRCKLCTIMLYSRDEAKHHRCELQRQCQYCSKRFKTRSGLYSHSYDCKSRKVNFQHCVICGYSTLLLYNLYLHQLSEHQYIGIKQNAIQGSELACVRCNVQFLSKRAYQVHSLRHSHPEARNIRNSCFICRKLFDTDEDYNHHRKVCKYSKKFPRKCQYCEDVLSSRHEYNQHLMAFHPSMEDSTRAKHRMCHLCGKMVGSKFSVHMHAHETRQSFPCTLCTPPVRLPSASAYVAHVLSAHAHRPYSCALCGLSYQIRNDCRDHILKIHAPVFPYKCIICEQKFSHSNFLVSHLKKAHRIITDKDPSHKLVPIRFKVITYPHMRINLSMFNKDILDLIKVEITDYLHEKTQVLEDYSDYVILDPSYKQDAATEAFVKAKTRVKSRSKDGIPKKKRRTPDSLTLAINSILEEVVEEIPEVYQNEVIIDENVEKGTLPIIDHEGERYVVINNVTYRIEND